jgi:uncharacterized protein YndB with AHSA1/START domain
VSQDERFEVSRTVDATPEQLFALLSDPSRHAEMDSANMLKPSDAGQLAGVGDTFVINMNNDFLGDYQIKNTVTAFEPGRTIGWAPKLHPEGAYADKLGDIKPGGHTYTWHLEPAGSGTKVTEVYDWSGVKDPQFKGFCPMLTEEQLAESIEKAGRAAG